MRHVTIYRKARLIDEFMDDFNKVRHRHAFSRKTANVMVKLLFPNEKFLGEGVVKTAHYIQTRRRGVVLKIGSEFYINADMKAYTSLPISLRNRYFAKIYWSTKYCILQKEGKRVITTVAERNAIRKHINWHLRNTQYKIVDIKASNVRQVDGRLKVIDANLVRKTAKAPFRVRDIGRKHG